MNDKFNRQTAPERITADDQTAVDFLRSFKPEWLEEMPMMITTHTPGKVTAVRREHYDPATRTGAFVTYWGKGANDPNNSWFVAHIIEASEAQYNDMVNRYCILQALSGCRPPLKPCTSARALMKAAPRA